jgi:hypothetical protein
MIHVDKMPWSHLEHCIKQRSKEGKKAEALSARNYENGLGDHYQKLAEQNQQAHQEGGTCWRSPLERHQVLDAVSGQKDRRAKSMADAERTREREHHQAVSERDARVQQMPTLSPLNVYPQKNYEEHYKQGLDGIRQETSKYFNAMTEWKEKNPAQLPKVAKDDWEDRKEQKVDSGLKSINQTQANIYAQLNSQYDRADERLEAHMDQTNQRCHLIELEHQAHEIQCHERKKDWVQKTTRELHSLKQMEKDVFTGEPGVSKYRKTKFAGYTPVVNSTPRGLKASQRIRDVEQYGVVERLPGTYGETTHNPRNLSARRKKGAPANSEFL